MDTGEGKMKREEASKKESQQNQVRQTQNPVRNFVPSVHDDTSVKAFPPPCHNQLSFLFQQNPFFEMDSSIFLTYPPFYLLSFIRSLDEGRKIEGKREEGEECKKRKRKKNKTAITFRGKMKKVGGNRCGPICARQFLLVDRVRLYSSKKSFFNISILASSTSNFLSPLCSFA